MREATHEATVIDVKLGKTNAGKPQLAIRFDAPIRPPGPQRSGVISTSPRGH